MKQALAISPLRAVLYVTSIVGGLWIGTLYLLLRLLGCRKLDASIFTILGLSSASAIFWLPVPNSYTWGSLSIMMALALLLFAEQRQVGASALCGRQRVHAQHHRHQLDGRLLDHVGALAASSKLYNSPSMRFAWWCSCGGCKSSSFPRRSFSSAAARRPTGSIIPSRESMQQHCLILCVP